MKCFPCPVCGNDLPCNDNRQIKCCYCGRLIQPQGFKNKDQKAEAIFKEQASKN